MFETDGDKKAIEEAQKSPRDRLLDQLALAMTDDATFLDDLTKRMAKHIDIGDLAERVACELPERKVEEAIAEEFENNIDMTNIVEELAKDTDFGEIAERVVAENIDFEATVEALVEDEGIETSLARAIRDSEKVDEVVLQGAASQLMPMLVEKLLGSHEMARMVEKAIEDKARAMLNAKFGLSS